MAPEVALKLPYTEKVDVYSFGILVWQMGRDRVPFKGMKRDDLMNTVVEGENNIFITCILVRFDCLLCDY
jgi:serine/threonine protein kinase